MSRPKSGESTQEQIAQKLPGYLPPDNRPKCLNCGKILPLAFMHKGTEGNGFYCFNPFAAKATQLNYGFEGDGFFCKKQCGYDYGVTVAHKIGGREKEMVVALAARPPSKPE